MWSAAALRRFVTPRLAGGPYRTRRASSRRPTRDPPAIGEASANGAPYESESQLSHSKFHRARHLRFLESDGLYQSPEIGPTILHA
jgi:hypothetical protein